MGRYPFMATPYLEGSIRGDQRKQEYNDSFKRARQTVERSIGILKSKFGALKDGLRLRNMVQCTRLIEILCSVHNFIIRANQSDEIADEEINLEDFGPAVQMPENDEFQQTRDRILHHYF